MQTENLVCTCLGTVCFNNVQIRVWLFGWRVIREVVSHTIFSFMAANTAAVFLVFSIEREKRGSQCGSWEASNGLQQSRPEPCDSETHRAAETQQKPNIKKISWKLAVRNKTEPGTSEKMCLVQICGGKKVMKEKPFHVTFQHVLK